MYKILFKTVFVLTVFMLFSCDKKKKETVSIKKQPNVLIVLTDQLRTQATGYAGDPNVKTPNIDRLEAMSANFQNAVSGMPVCTPFKASLLTGQRPLTNGVFMNDVQLDTNAVSMGKVYAHEGYRTGFIGKWHIDGRGRESFIPPGNRRQGFQFWMANECTHNYNKSVYYDNDDPTPKKWEGYDTFEQTDAAIEFINSKNENPFLLVLSWGTPHAPYGSAPKKYKDMFKAEDMILRPNVPKAMHKQVKKDIAGYYAHIAAIDDMIGKLINSLKENNQLDNTIIVFTSDHGDLLGSHGAYKKQQPYEESIRTPMLFYIPESLGIKPGVRNAVFNSEDIFPTLLGLSGMAIPKSVEGINYRNYLEGKDNSVGKETIITCVQPFGQWNRPKRHGKEYRGLVTQKYTYVKDLNGPWLLFDNDADPYQMNNLINNKEYKEIQADLEKRLTKRLKANGDEFLPGSHYLEKWGIKVNDEGTVPYRHLY
ncbi:sulfatase [Wenyingzhuangia fucanilytica]|uniref:Sulfatase n=1 Tax=Wenyingzhuangia fucanilytica TaxID=1790137 RepID=A0A1B1Y508_9FLAO|nr:sulfatase [Wenyingzhuangia fucanilytica]ANW95854.1 sulfatase [Wenyingzhuangia fucanilytica]